MPRLQCKGKNVQVLLISQNRSVLGLSSRPTNRLTNITNKVFYIKMFFLFLIPALYFPPNSKIN